MQPEVSLFREKSVFFPPACPLFFYIGQFPFKTSWCGHLSKSSKSKHHILTFQTFLTKFLEALEGTGLWAPRCTSCSRSPVRGADFSDLIVLSHCPHPLGDLDFHSSSTLPRTLISINPNLKVQDLQTHNRLCALESPSDLTSFGGVFCSSHLPIWTLPLRRDNQFPPPQEEVLPSPPDTALSCCRSRCVYQSLYPGLTVS